MIEKHTDGHFAFTPEEVADGKMIKAINLLIEFGYEFKVWTDGYCTIIDYIECDSENHFEAVGESEVVVDGQYVNWEAYDADGND